MEQILHALQTIVARDGAGYLSGMPHAVYQELLSTPDVQRKLARITYLTLLCDIPHIAQKAPEHEIAAAIERDCCLRQDMSAQLAHMYKRLFDTGDAPQYELGFQQLIDDPEWDSEVHIRARWPSEDGYWGNVMPMDCTFGGTITWRVADPEMLYDALSDSLRANPLQSGQDLADEISQQIERELRDPFVELVESFPGEEDVNPEEFGEDGEDYVRAYLDGIGIEIESFDCYGDVD